MELTENTATVCVQTSDWCWGVGADLETAIKNARGAGSKVTKTSRTVDYIVFEFDSNVKPDTVIVDQMGTCRWEVAVPQERNFKQGLVREWIREKGKERLLNA